MAAKNDYNFNEKVTEYSVKQGKEVPVWVSPKYSASRKTAIDVIEKYDAINESDFWILMNETKSGKMAYTGLIISHNACLKINDALPDTDKFKSECVTLDKEGYGDSLVYTYNCPEQGIYEVGEVNKTNCKNAYPYAMALKRCMDRVILKNSKIAYGGIYSDSEADEFKERIEEPKEIDPEMLKPATAAQKKNLIELCETNGININDILADVGMKDGDKMTKGQYGEALIIIKKIKDKK
jgi:hypothetical protein